MSRTEHANHLPLRVAVVGHFQVGKSTLINCLLRECRAASGDTTQATTAEAGEYPSPCGRVLFVDTPGVNAKEKHDAITMREMERTDAALLVTRSTGQLDQPVLQLARDLARRRLTAAVVVNCWDGRDGYTGGDPEKVNRTVIATIREQLVKTGLQMPFFELINVEWAAAARQCLDPRRVKVLLRGVVATGDATLLDLETRSRFSLVENHFLPET